MQELNINPNEVVTPNKVEVRTPEELKKRQDLISGLKDKLKSTGQTSSNITNTPKKKFNSRSCLLVFFGILTIFLIGTTLFFAVKYFSEKGDDNGNGQTEETTSTTSTEDGENGEVEKPDLKNGRIAYIDASSNLNLVDPYGENTGSIPITLDAGLSIYRLYFINKEEIAFTACNQEKTACSLFSIDIEEKKQNKMGDYNGFLIDIDWINKNNFVYAINTPTGIELMENKGSLTESIARLDFVYVSRDPFIEDYNEIILSPNDEQVLFVSTSSGNGFNFTTYVYNLERELLDTIENSTMSVWKDDSSIIYRYYSNKNNGPLYIREIEDKKSSELVKSPDSSYNPQIKGRYMIYWEFRGDGTPYIYDFLNETHLELYDEGAYPVWIGPKNVLIAKTRNCEVDECKSRSTMEQLTDLFFESILLVDTNSLKMQETAIDPQIFSKVYALYWE